MTPILTGHNQRNHRGEKLRMRGNWLLYASGRLWPEFFDTGPRGRPTAMEYQLRENWARHEAGLRRQRERPPGFLAPLQ